MKNIKIVGQTQIGYSHILNDKGCQDYSLKYQSDEVVIVVIADGHGASKYKFSDVGAKLACEILINKLKSNQKELLKENINDFISDFITIWKDEVVSYYKEHKKKEIIDKEYIIEMFGTTCNFTIIKDNLVLLCKIGDGNTYFINDEIKYPLKDEEFLKKAETDSLISNEYRYEFFQSKVEEGFILMSTDGHVDSFPNKEAFEQHLFNIKDYIIENGVEDFGDSLGTLLSDISKNGSGDDITLYLLQIKGDE